MLLAVWSNQFTHLYTCSFLIPTIPSLTSLLYPHTSTIQPTSHTFPLLYTLLYDTLLYTSLTLTLFYTTLHNYNPNLTPLLYTHVQPHLYPPPYLHCTPLHPSTHTPLCHPTIHTITLLYISLIPPYNPHHTHPLYLSCTTLQPMPYPSSISPLYQPTTHPLYLPSTTLQPIPYPSSIHLSTYTPYIFHIIYHTPSALSSLL